MRRRSPLRARLLALAVLLPLTIAAPGAARCRRADRHRGRRPRRALALRPRAQGLRRHRAQPRSKVWFTVADGVLSDVYFPTNDNTEYETLQYVVTDGATFTDLQTRDMTYTVRRSTTAR